MAKDLKELKEETMQIVEEKGDNVTDRRNLWSKGPEVRTGLACVKNLEEA